MYFDDGVIQIGRKDQPKITFEEQVTSLTV